MQGSGDNFIRSLQRVARFKLIRGMILLSFLESCERKLREILIFVPVPGDGDFSPCFYENKKIIFKVVK